LLCAEGLSNLLSHEEEAGGIDENRVCRNAPSMSHLPFANDSLIPMKAGLLNAISLQQVLDYENSGQLVSRAKSSIIFSPITQIMWPEQTFAVSYTLTEKPFPINTWVSLL
jgi:hypothetical protein